MEQQLKALRKKLGLTQEEFAARLGIKRAAISNYEIGRNEPIDAVISLICREFNVSEIWLHTGEGEMFVPKGADALDELAKQYGLSGGDYVLVEKFLKLKPSERQAVIAYMQDVVSALNEGTTLPAPDTTGQDRAQPDIAAELAELKRQNQALAAKVAAMEEEDALLGLTDASSKSPSASVGNFNPAQRAKNNPGEA